MLVLVWTPSYFLIRDVNTWQLVINTITTIITFLMVALLQNSQTVPTKPSSTSSTHSRTGSRI